MTVLFLVLYVVVLIGVSIRLGLREKPEEYAIGARAVGVFGIFASTFTLIGAGEFLTVASLAFLNDGAAITLLAGYGLGMMILGVFATSARRNSGTRHYLSLPDFAHDRFGAVAGGLTSLLTVAAFFALLVLQLFAGAIVLSEIAGLSTTWAAFLSAAVVVVYLLFAGFSGVILTDKIQFTLMLVGLPLLAFIAIPSAADIGKISSLSFGPLATISVLITGVFVVLGSGDIWQRLYAARSNATARTGMIAAGLGFAIYGVILALIGIAAREASLTDDPDAAFLAVVLAQDQGLLSALVVVAVFSAILSTADTETFLISSLVENERRRFILKEDPRGSEPKSAAIRVFIPLVAALGAVASIYSESLVSIYEILLYAFLALTPIVVIGTWRRISPANSTVALLLGIASLCIVAFVPSLGLSQAILVVVPGGVWALLASQPHEDAEDE